MIIKLKIGILPIKEFAYINLNFDQVFKKIFKAIILNEKCLAKLNLWGKDKDVTKYDGKNWH